MGFWLMSLAVAVGIGVFSVAGYLAMEVIQAAEKIIRGRRDV